MLLLPRGSPRSSKPIRFPYRALNLFFIPGRVVRGRHPSQWEPLAALGRCQGCVLGLGVHSRPTLASPNCVQGEELRGGDEEGEGKVFVFGKRQAEIDTPCHFFWQARGVLGGLEVRGARSLPGSSIVFFFVNPIVLIPAPSPFQGERGPLLPPGCAGSGAGSPLSPAEAFSEQGAGSWDFLMQNAAGKLGSPGQGINDTVRGEFEFPHQ